MRPEPLPPTSLVISTLNRPDLLRDTIKSVLDGEDVPAEIVVVDQSEQPNPTVERLGQRGCDIRYAPMREKGLSRGRNRGIALARHDLLVFTDDDLLAAPGWFGSLVRALLRDPAATAVTGRVVAAPRPFGVTLGLREGERAATYRGRIGQDVLAGGNMAIGRSTLVEVGVFDERLGAGSRFPAAEDNDLGFRLLEAGYSIRYVPEALLYHRAWRPRSAYFGMRWNYGRGQGAFYAKHVRSFKRHVIGRMIRQIGRNFYLAAMRARTEPRRAIGQLVFVAGLLHGCGGWLLSRPAAGSPPKPPRG